MSFLLRRRPRIAQPQSGDQLDWADPLLDGLVFAFDGSTWMDHVTGRYAAASGGPSLVSTDEGLATYFNGSSYLDFGDDDSWDVTGPLTIFWRGRFDGVAGAFRCIVSKTASGGVSHTPFDFYINSGTGNPRIFRANGSSYSAQDLNTVPSAGVIQTLLFADDADPSTAGSGFVERSSGVTSVVSGATSVTGTSSPLRLGQRSDGATALTGWINCLYIWARRLSDDEYGAVYDAPRRAFARQRIWVPVSAGGGPSTYEVSISESVSAADAFSAASVLASALSEAASASDVVAAAAEYQSTLSESASATDAVSGALTVSGALSEAASASDALSSAASLSDSLSEAASASDEIDGSVAANTYSAELAEAASASDSWSAAVVLAAQLVEAVTAQDAVTSAAVLGAILSEAASASDSMAAAGVFAAAISEAASASDAWSSAVASVYEEALDEAVSASDAWSVIAGTAPSAQSSRRIAAAAVLRSIVGPAANRRIQ